VAKELTEKGVEVLMLEAVRLAFRPAISPSTSWPYQLKYAVSGNEERGWRINPSSAFAMVATNTAKHFSWTTTSIHIRSKPTSRFMWIRGRQVGGKTFCWARVSTVYSDIRIQSRQP